MSPSTPNTILRTLLKQGGDSFLVEHYQVRGTARIFGHELGVLSMLGQQQVPDIILGQAEPAFEALRQPSSTATAGLDAGQQR